MPNITLTITAETPEELFSSIKGAAVIISDDVPAKELPETEKSVTGNPITAKERPATHETSKDEPTPDEPTYTIEQIRKLTTEAARAHSREAVKEILNKFEVSGVGELKKDQYTAFVEKLEALNNG